MGSAMGSACLFTDDDGRKHQFKSRPTQTNPSSDKAELHAILHGLEKCSKTTKLQIYTDSQNSIKYISEMSRSPTERNILKINDYPIVEKIQSEMERFDTRPEILWVRGHDGNENNNAVHDLAQSACRDNLIEPVDVTPYKIGVALERDLHLYHQPNEEANSAYRTDTYPRSFLKNKFAVSLRETNIDRLNRKWGEEAPDLNNDEERDNSARKSAIELDLAPDYELTTKALNSVLDRTNHLDSTNQKVHTFRINLLNRDTLYTLDLLISQCKFWVRKGNTCVNCDTELDNYDHIWECKKLHDQFDDLRTRTLELVNEAMEQRCAKNKTTFTDDLKDRLANSTDTFFLFEHTRGYNANRFLSSPEAKGVITPQTCRNFHERANLTQTTGSWVYTTTVAAWTRSLFELWWNPRTKLIQKEQRQEVKALKKKKVLDKKKKKEKKDENRKRKRDLDLKKLIDAREVKQRKMEAKNKKAKPKFVPKTQKEKTEIEKTIRRSRLAAKKEKQRKWEKALQRLKDDRASKQNATLNNLDKIIETAQTSGATKRKRIQDQIPNDRPQKRNRQNGSNADLDLKPRHTPEEDGEEPHPSSTHIAKKPPDKT